MDKTSTRAGIVLSSQDKIKERRMPVTRIWYYLWGGNPPGNGLAAAGILIGLLMTFPIIYVVWRSVQAGQANWLRLLDTRIPVLMTNTLLITFTTMLTSIVLGVSLAWLVYRCDVPGRKIWRWLLVLPLMLPSYVGAVAYIMVLGPVGWMRQTFGFVPVNIYSFGGVLFVMTLFKFPYVFLAAGAAIRRMNQSYEDTARSLGMSGWQIFWKVSFPFLRPAIGAGAILTALCVLSEFGVVAIMRYNTFTSAIYYQMESLNRDGAAVLSMLLILLTLGFLWIEARGRRKQRYHQTGGTFRPVQTLALKKWKVAALGWVLLVLSLSVLLPIGILLYWSWQGIQMGALSGRFWGYTRNSIQVAGLAAILSMILALPVVYLKSRHPSFLSGLINKLSSTGYALPGVIVALGLIYLFNSYIPWLYNTFFMISFAYLIRFLPQSVQYSGASLNQISPRVDEAGRSLGLSPARVMARIIVPLISPGLLAGGALVFVSSIKELPATLLLRPPGYDTLAVRVWVESSEAVYHMAAPAALLITFVSIIPLRLIMKKR